MTPDQVKLVQDSFAKVAPISDTYRRRAVLTGRLFEIAPQVRAMFPDDMSEQRKKLMATLAIVVNGLNNLDTILPAASALAKRHVGYGAEAGPLPGGWGGTAVDAGKRSWGDAWTPPVAAAWTQAYTTLSGFMISEAYGQKAA